MTSKELQSRYLDAARYVALLAEQRRDVDRAIDGAINNMKLAFQQWQQAELEEEAARQK